MDPLSGVLSLLKPQNTMCGGFDVGGEWSLQFPQHEGIKCYAVVSGQCWLAVEDVPEAVHLKTGDCFLLPLGRPFRLTSDLALPPVDFKTMCTRPLNGGIAIWNGGGDVSGVGGYFGLEGKHAGILLGMLPPIVHIKKESDKLALRWSIERMMHELREPQSRVASWFLQHLAHTDVGSGLAGRIWRSVPERQRGMALRAGGPADERGHPRDCTTTRLIPGRLQELAQKVGMSRSRICREIQGDRWLNAHRLPDPLADALGRGSAEELRRSRLGHRAVARLRIRERLQHGLQKGHGVFTSAV